MFLIVSIYFFQVLDLLEARDKTLQIVEDQKKQIVVMGLTEKSISNVYEFNELFGPASNNRWLSSILNSFLTGLNFWKRDNESIRESANPF